MIQFFIDNYWASYVLVIVMCIFAGICSISVNTTFKKYSKVKSVNNVTAAEVARQILDNNGLSNVQIYRVAGNLTDHFDPRTNSVSLSENVYDSTSVGAIGVAAHEVGHAIQYATDYGPIRIRNGIAPFVSICSRAWIWLVILGFAMSFFYLTAIGIFIFAFIVIFQLITLPVEFNASNRAISTLSSMQLLTSEELGGAKKVLGAAAMTYVASLMVSIAQLLRLIASANRRN